MSVQRLDGALELPESHQSSSYDTHTSDHFFQEGHGAVLGRTEMRMNGTTSSMMENPPCPGTYNSTCEDVSLPWQETNGKSNPTNTTSTSSSPPGEALLGVLLDSFKELFRESEEFCKKLLPNLNLQEEVLLKKLNTEGSENIEASAFSELFKKITTHLQKVNLNQNKIRVMQRSLSVDSPRTPQRSERFKVVTLDISGIQQDGKGATKVQ